MKKRLGIDITGSWTFTPGAAGAGTIAFSGITLSLDQILQVVNATRNTTIYNFGIVELGEAAYSNNVLTLTASTTGMSASDRLMVWVDVDDAQKVQGTGELVEALEAMRMCIQSLERSIGQSYPDVAGRLRVALDAISASLTLATVSTVTGVTTVTTVSTLTNQSQVGGNAANDQIPALMHLQADNLRRNISVT